MEAYTYPMMRNFKMKISNGLEEHTIDPDLSLSTAP